MTARPVPRAQLPAGVTCITTADGSPPDELLLAQIEQFRTFLRSHKDIAETKACVATYGDGNCPHIPGQPTRPTRTRKEPDVTDTPDPQIVRDFARQAILSSAEDVDYIGISEQFSDDKNWPSDEDASDAMLEAVDAERQKAIITVSWPGQQPATGRPAADFAHAAEDVRQHLALRARAVNDEVLRSPEVISVARADGHAHALMETVVRTLLAERDALAAYVDRLAAPDDEAIHAAAILRDWFKSEGTLVMDEEDLGHVQTVLTDYERITAAPKYFVDGQPVDRESYEAWADEGRETDYDEAGIYYDEHDDDENGGPF